MSFQSKKNVKRASIIFRVAMNVIIVGMCLFSLVRYHNIRSPNAIAYAWMFDVQLVTQFLTLCLSETFDNNALMFIFANWVCVMVCVAVARSPLQMTNQTWLETFLSSTCLFMFSQEGFRLLKTFD